MDTYRVAYKTEQDKEADYMVVEARGEVEAMYLVDKKLTTEMGYLKGGVMGVTRVEKEE